jgi:hypothetical protein
MKFHLPIMLFTGALCLVGCGGGQGNENTASVQIINASPANDASVVPIVPSNGQGNVNGGFPANGNVMTVNPPGGNVKQLTYPAPDDSEYSASMDSSGVAVETRTFRSDKYIAKVVRTTRDPENKTIAVYLRSGKVVNLAGDRWPEIRSIPVTALYEAAGIKAPAEPTQANTAVKQKPADRPIK